MILDTENEANILELHNIVYNPSNKIELEGSIEILEEVIGTLNKNTESYLSICNLLSIAYQKMIEENYWFDKNVVYYLKKSIYYCKEIEENYFKIENNSEILINQYVAMLEEANCLAKLADYENKENNINKALKLFDEVIKKTEDMQAKYLSIMNKSKVEINVCENNIKSFKEINKNLDKLIKTIQTLKEAFDFFSQNEALIKNCFICLANIEKAIIIRKTFTRTYFNNFMKIKHTQIEKIKKTKKYTFEVIYD